MGKRYKIDARKVEVIDPYNVFLYDDVENVLWELSKKITSGGKEYFEVLINEFPHPNLDFFQNQDMLIYRSSEDVDLQYDGANKKITHNNGLTADLKSTTFNSNFQMVSPMIKTSIQFKDGIGKFIFNLSKKGDDYYKIVAEWGQGLKAYRIIGGSPLLIAGDTGVTFTDKNNPYEIKMQKIGEGLAVLVNGISRIGVTNGDIDDFGTSEIIMETTGINKRLQLDYIQFGQYVDGI